MEGRFLLGVFVALLTLLPAVLAREPGHALGAPPQERLEENRAAQAEVAEREAVLTSTIERLGAQAQSLSRETAALRNREAVISAELAVKESALAAARSNRERAERRLAQVRERLRRAIAALERMLVGIYKSDVPDVLTVVLDADGFEDLLSRAEYLSRVEDYQARLVSRVQSLRAEARVVVVNLRDTEARIGSERDQIAKRRQEIVATRSALAAKENRLAAHRVQSRDALAGLEQRQAQLEEIEAEIEQKIQEELAATATPPAPAGPVKTPSSGSSSIIWPVQGTLTSPFGPRWGRLHAGIDIGAPGGTPIKAAAGGTVAMAGPNGGYGNYTCINHSGGLATCYAHQSSIATSVGAAVEQGEVIGAVGNTGNSFGDHLHFEVRLNGVPQDPLGYL